MNIKQEIADVTQRVAPGVGAGAVGWINLNTQLINTWLAITVLLATIIGYIVKVVMDVRRDKRAERVASAILANYRANPNPETLAGVQLLLQKQDSE